MEISWDAVEQQIKQTPSGMNDALRKGVYLVGAGFHGKMVSEYLAETGIPISGFADNDAAKQVTGWAGMPVIALESLGEIKPEIAFITARHTVSSLQAQLDAMGGASLPFDAWFVCQNIKRLEHVHSQLLNDAVSRRAYSGVLLAMLTGKAAYCKAIAEPDQYFALPEFRGTGAGIYVDAGAYVGDTIERALWAHNGVFGHIYAFEPGKKQMQALEARMKRLMQEWAFDETAFTCVRAGLGDKEQTCCFDATHGLLQSSHFAQKGEEVEIKTLDSFLQGKPVTTIKADIEGMEMAMLQGAADTIRTHAPKLVISIYHRPQDLFAIPEYIHSLVPDYRMALRHHAPSLMETVLYCWRENA